MRSARQFFLGVMLFLSTVTMAQHWRMAYGSGSLMQYALPASKFAGLFLAPVHFKGSVGITCQWNKNETHQVLQNVSIGFGYHRFIQCIIPISTEIGYRYQSTKKIFFDVFLGDGYLHSIPLNSRYILNQGVYEKTNKGGKPQGMVNARIGLGYAFKVNTTIEISYENLLQTPFIKSYVPILPYNIFNISYSVPLAWVKHSFSRAKTTTITPAF